MVEYILLLENLHSVDVYKVGSFNDDIERGASFTLDFQGR